jgi:dolichol-phosphate mannosyltransferase
MAKRWLAALPVFNEVGAVGGVLDEVRRYANHILTVDDGSTDGTSELLDARDDIIVVRHAINRGYGAALQTAFQFAIDEGFDFVVTLDCDGQHQPKRIPRFIAACRDVDMVSGSRYLKKYPGDDEAPPERMFINKTITAEIIHRLGLSLTDAFCGFKAYRVASLKQLEIQDTGYAMPLELWAQAAMLGMRILEIPVPRLYLDLKRSFGGALDHAETRLNHYRAVLDRSIQQMEQRGYSLEAARTHSQAT